MTSLVPPAWLADRLHDSKLRILDASWHMPAAGQDAHAHYEARHIPGAQFFDVEEISDHNSPYPHMLPNAQEFEEAVSDMGIENAHHVVVYDTHGLFSAARVWWTFKVFGHEHVSVLDGGLPRWLAEGHPVTHEMPPITPSSYRAAYSPAWVRSAEEVLQAAKEGNTAILDARGSSRFRGEMPEPRPGLRSGHIPGSLNIPYNELLTPPYQTLRTLPEIQQIFSSVRMQDSSPIITSCGSGVTACILALALDQLGKKNISVYDGSWAEWGSRQDLPVERG